MEKRNTVTRNSELDQIETVHKEDTIPEVEEVGVMLNYNVHVIVTGEVTGRKYDFLHGGSIVKMDKRDAEKLLNHPAVLSCCGTTSSPKFSIVKE